MPLAAAILHEGANTYEERSAMYGENFRSFPEVMMGLFPEGIHLQSYEDWMRMQFVMMNAIKMTRYAANFKRGGHSDSMHDMMVYAAMQDATDAEFNSNRDQQRRQGAANEDNGESR